jgi:hypothetical protein
MAEPFFWTSNSGKRSLAGLESHFATLPNRIWLGVSPPRRKLLILINLRREKNSLCHFATSPPASGVFLKKMKTRQSVVSLHASFTHSLANREGESQGGHGGQQLAILKQSDQGIDRDSDDHFFDDRLSQSHKMNQESDLHRGVESGDHARAMIT